MRVSTSQIFDSGVQGLLRNQSSLLNTQNHISASKRVLKPSDDPVAAARALVVTQSQEVNKQYIANQGYASDQLRLLESKLGSAVATIQDIIDVSISAGNGALTDQGRKDIATELRQRLDELLATANSQDGSGNYIFSGYKTNVQPFALNPDPLATTYSMSNPYVDYQGDQGQVALQVDASRQMAISENGASVFVRVTDDSGNLTNASVFDSLKNMIDTLETPIASNPTFKDDYDKALSEFQSFLNTAGRVRSSVGARMSELDSLGESASNLSLQYDETLSNLQDLDYISAMTDFTKQQIQLEAAQKSFVQISGLSLFNYL
ncbi:MAG: flagellar hook-associated protein FlgL [Propionivibrio sp.]